MRAQSIRLLRSVLRVIALSLLVITFFQRKLLYHPSHELETRGLKPWTIENLTIGYSREVPSPGTVWLLLHGNGGQAAHRQYALASFSERDSVFILEYPGYGTRQGAPSLQSLNQAAKQAYDTLRGQFPNRPICIVGESIGTGPACSLAASTPPPDKIVLIVPFDILTRVAAHHFPFLPVKFLLRDNWNNIEALKPYRGPLEIFAATDDQIIPRSRAKALADSFPGAVFHEISGGHNEWPLGLRVRIRNP